jgi:hypothetical protein
MHRFSGTEQDPSPRPHVRVKMLIEQEMIRSLSLFPEYTATSIPNAARLEISTQYSKISIVVFSDFYYE